MARPRAEFPAAAALRAMADDEGRLAVRVTPGARSEGIEIVEGRVLVKVRPRPEDGKASAAVADLLAQALGVAPSAVEMLRGATSREKLFRIPLAKLRPEA
ncbi:MAG: DUF167 domain-containing protein [Novosphingobium sp.]|nr:DUF167 domain-containing protein [Novosphingobium sp.]